MSSNNSDKPLSVRERFKVMVMGLAMILILGFLFVVILNFQDFNQTLARLSKSWQADELIDILGLSGTLFFCYCVVPAILIFGLVLMVLGALGIRNSLTINILHEMRPPLSVPTELRGSPKTSPQLSETDHVPEESRDRITPQAQPKAKEEPETPSLSRLGHLRMVVEEARYHSTVDPNRNPRRSRWGIALMVLGVLVFLGAVQMVAWDFKPFQMHAILMVGGFVGGMILLILGGFFLLTSLEHRQIPSWIGFLAILAPLLAFFLYVALQ